MIDLHLSTQSFPELSRLAAEQDRPVAVFDLEATQRSPHFANFQVLEVGLVVVKADGTVRVAEQLFDPGCPIPEAVVRLTGIHPGDVRGQPGWNREWASALHQLAQDCLTIGYNSLSYDCPAVVRLNQRWNLTTSFPHHLDVKAHYGLGSLEGSLSAAGLTAPLPRHRALSDALSTCLLLEALRSGVCELLPSASRVSRRQQLVELAAGGQRLALEGLAERFGRAPGTLERDVLALLAEGALKPEPFVDPAVQAGLDPVIEEGCAAVWTEQERYLRPLMDWLEARGRECSYFQLRLSLYRHGLL